MNVEQWLYVNPDGVPEKNYHVHFEKLNLPYRGKLTVYTPCQQCTYKAYTSKFSGALDLSLFD